MLVARRDGLNISRESEEALKAFFRTGYAKAELWQCAHDDAAAGHVLVAASPTPSATGEEQSSCATEIAPTTPRKEDLAGQRRRSAMTLPAMIGLFSSATNADVG